MLILLWRLYIKLQLKSERITEHVIEGVRARKHLTAILEKKCRFWHQASQHDNPDLLNHTNKGILVTQKTQKIKYFLTKFTYIKRKKTQFLLCIFHKTSQMAGRYFLALTPSFYARMSIVHGL